MQGLSADSIVTAPPLPARPLGRTSGSMKRHPDLPSTDRLNPAGSSHNCSVSQPELSLPNFGAGEREAWDSDRPKSVPLEPPGSPTNPGATLGSGLTRLITKTSIAQLFSKSRADIAVTSPSTSTLHSTEEEEEQVEENTIAGADREPVEPNDDFQTDELQRAIDESIREAERRRAKQEQDYLLGPSHPWLDTVPSSQPLAEAYQYPYHPSSPCGNPYDPSQTRAHLAKTDSTDEELQRALAESRRVSIPTIQLQQQPLSTPQEELQRALEMSRYDY